MSVRVSTANWRAPWLVIRPDSRLRLVTATVRVSPPGSRGDLGAIGGFVEHQQHPLVRHQAAEQRRLSVRGDGNPDGLDAQRVEEPTYRHGRLHRVAVEAEAP